MSSEIKQIESRGTNPPSPAALAQDTKNGPVFLSGATGSLGSEVLRILLETGFRVKILVKDANKISPLIFKKWENLNLPGLIDDVVEGDLSLSDDGVVKGKIFSGMRDCTVVYHCAGIPEGWQINEDVWDAVNRNGTEVMLDAAAAAKVRMFVHVSSFETLAAEEADNFRELTPYQKSKLNAETAVQLARSKHAGMRCVMVNAASFYGPTSRSCWVNHLILSMLIGRTTKVGQFANFAFTSVTFLDRFLSAAYSWFTFQSWLA